MLSSDERFIDSIRTTYCIPSNMIYSYENFFIKEYSASTIIYYDFYLILDLSFCEYLSGDETKDKLTFFDLPTSRGINYAERLRDDRVVIGWSPDIPVFKTKSDIINNLHKEILFRILTTKNKEDLVEFLLNNNEPVRLTAEWKLKELEGIRCF